MRTLKNRVDSLEERIKSEQRRHFEHQLKSRPEQEVLFFCIYGFWPESVGDELPPGMEFTVRGIKLIVTARWEGEDQKTYRAAGDSAVPV